MTDTSPRPRGRALLLARRRACLAAQWVLGAGWTALNIRRSAGNDLRIYLEAAKAWRQRRDPYVPGYLYPPHLAWALSSIHHSRGFVAAWSLANGAALCGTVAAATSFAGLGGTLAGVIAFGLLLTEPFRRAVGLGNVEPLVSFATVGSGWLLYRTRREGRRAASAFVEALLAAALVTVAVLLKVAPGFVALFMLRQAIARDRGSGLALLLLGALLLVALRLEGTVAFLGDALSTESIVQQRRISDSNVSLVGYFGGLGLRLPSWVPLLLAFVLAVPALRRMPEDPVRGWNAGICLSAFVSPIIWDIAYLRLLAPIGWLSGWLVAGNALLPRRPRARLAEALLLVLLTMVVLNAGYFRSYSHALLFVFTPLIPTMTPLVLYWLLLRRSCPAPVGNTARERRVDSGVSPSAGR